MFLGRLLARAQPSDGSAAALETVATGFSPAFLDNAAEAEATASRRERAPGGGEDQLVQALSAKLLHSWLQNRHQTLYPLTLNLRALRPEQAATVAGLLAALLLCGRPSAEADPAPARDWLRSIGADAACVAAFDAALADTPPLHLLLEQAVVQDVAVYAYVATLVASDARHPASLRLLDVVQARLDLPTAVVRSAMRRYRR